MSSPDASSFAPVLSALQVPHTQRLQELQGDHRLGLPLVHRYAGLSLVQRLLPGNSRAAGGGSDFGRASRAVCRLPLSSESQCGAGPRICAQPLGHDPGDTALTCLDAACAHRGGRDPVEGGPLVVDGWRGHDS